MATAKAKLVADGFHHRASFPTALPFWVWDIEAVCETDRALRLTEETVLRLIGAGIAEPGTIAEVMGLDDSDILSSTIGQLMMRGCLEHAEGRLAVTAGGKAVLGKRAVREPEKKGVRVLLDPYKHKVSLIRGKGEHLRPAEARRRGLHSLPIFRQPTARDLDEQHLNIQALLEAEAKMVPGSPNAQHKVDLLKVTALGEAQAAYLEAVVEAWQRPLDGRWDWRLLVEGEEDARAEAHFRECEKEGGDVLPLAGPAEADENEADRLLGVAFEAGEPADVEARLDALGGSGPAFLVVPPYPFGYADLDVLLELGAWLAEAAEEKRDPPAIQVSFGRLPAAAEAKVRANPMRELGGLLREAGAETGEREGLPTRHGVLVCGQAAFVCRYRVSEVQGRGRGIPWAECRKVALGRLPAAFRGEDPRKRERANAPRGPKV